MCTHTDTHTLNKVILVNGGDKQKRPKLMTSVGCCSTGSSLGNQLWGDVKVQYSCLPGCLVMMRETITSDVCLGWWPKPAMAG